MAPVHSRFTYAWEIRCTPRGGVGSTIRWRSGDTHRVRPTSWTWQQREDVAASSLEIRFPDSVQFFNAWLKINPLAPGTKVELYVDDVLRFTGWLMEHRFRYSADDRSVTVIARDRMGMLKDACVDINMERATLRSSPIPPYDPFVLTRSIVDGNLFEAIDTVPEPDEYLRPWHPKYIVEVFHIKDGVKTRIPLSEYEVMYDIGAIYFRYDPIKFMGQDPQDPLDPLHDLVDIATEIHADFVYYDTVDDEDYGCAGNSTAISNLIRKAFCSPVASGGLGWTEGTEFDITDETIADILSGMKWDTNHGDGDAVSFLQHLYDDPRIGLAPSYWIRDFNGDGKVIAKLVAQDNDAAIDVDLIFDTEFPSPLQNIYTRAVLTNNEGTRKNISRNADWVDLLKDEHSYSLGATVLPGPPDIDNDWWQTQISGTTNLWSVIDEVVTAPNDADYIQDDGVDADCTISFKDPLVHMDHATDVELWVRATCDIPSGSIPNGEKILELKAELIIDSNVEATVIFSHADLKSGSSAFLNKSDTGSGNWTEAELDEATVRFRSYDIGGTGNRWNILVSACQLNISYESLPKVYIKPNEAAASTLHDLFETPPRYNHVGNHRHVGYLLDDEKETSWGYFRFFDKDVLKLEARIEKDVNLFWLDFGSVEPIDLIHLNCAYTFRNDNNPSAVQLDLKHPISPGAPPGSVFEAVNGLYEIHENQRFTVEYSAHDSATPDEDTWHPIHDNLYLAEVDPLDGRQSWLTTGGIDTDARHIRVVINQPMMFKISDSSTIGNEVQRGLLWWMTEFQVFSRGKVHGDDEEQPTVQFTDNAAASDRCMCDLAGNQVDMYRPELLAITEAMGLKYRTLVLENDDVWEFITKDDVSGSSADDCSKVSLGYKYLVTRLDASSKENEWQLRIDPRPDIMIGSTVYCSKIDPNLKFLMHGSVLQMMNDQPNHLITLSDHETSSGGEGTGFCA